MHMKLGAWAQPLNVASVFLRACGLAVLLGGCGGSSLSTGSIESASRADGGHGSSSSSNGNAGGGDTSCAVANGVVTGGCDAGASNVNSCPAGESCDTSTSGSGAPASGCVAASLGCGAGVTGYSCAPDADPGSDDPTLICGAATTSGSVYDYCCRSWPTGNGCVRDPDFPCGFNAYALQCSSGSIPSNIDPGLQCGDNFSQSNGDNVFCCTGL